MALCLSLFFSFLVCAPAAQLRRGRVLNDTVADVPAASEELLPPRFRQELDNHWDLQYTANITVGGQEVSAVLDSGSFELLVFSDRCEACGDVGLYSDAKSSTFSRTALEAEHRFGSGTTKSSEAFEDLAVGPLSTTGQHFWEVIEADMNILSDGFFHAILGVGPPKSAGRFADINAQSARSTDPDADNLQQVAAQTAKYPGFLQSANVPSYSVCFGKEPRSPGYFVWNDDAVEREPAKFTSLKVDTDDYYWSSTMTSSKIGSPENLEATIVDLGCGASGDDGCRAVFDTGSSLLAAPREAVNAIQGILDAWENDGNCSDLSGLPEIQFELDGRQFSLPPEAYVGQVEGHIDDALLEFMPQLKQDVDTDSMSACKVLIMVMEDDPEFSSTWVLGMPFFRKYYTSFILNTTTAEPSSVALAPADDECEPTDAADSLLRKASTENPHTAMHLDAARIRAPKMKPRRVRKAVALADA